MKKKIQSWGNTSIKEIDLLEFIEEEKKVLTFGNNNSYGDSSIPLDCYGYSNPSNKIVKGFEPSRKTISDYLQLNKKMLFGIPGKNNVTLGGAAASDVHGKDGLWGGSFIKNIKRIQLELPNSEIIFCSREENPEIFFTTVGGFGLTGSILNIELFENNIPYTNTYKSELVKGKGFKNLFSNFPVSEYVYSVGWVNLLSKDMNWIIHSDTPTENIENNFNSLGPTDNSKLYFPFVGLNIIKIINFIYYATSKNSKNKSKNLQKVLYPISFLNDTKNLAKKRKIVQIQFSIKDAKINELDELIKLLIEGQKPLLCSVKRTQENETKLNFSFVQRGWTIAIDFPFESFSNKNLRNFYKKLIEVEGKIYLAKDSTMIESEFKEMYENYSKWQAIVKKIDPKNKFQSEMSHRLGIKNW